MIERKIEKEYTSLVFGFPVLMHDMPMIKLCGEWAADVNWNQIEALVLLKLALTRNCLTGSQIRYIRLWAKMTQQAFADKFGITQPAVVKWEKTKDCRAIMNDPIQKQIRLFIVRRLSMDDATFRKAIEKIDDLIFDSKIISFIDINQSDLTDLLAM